MGKLSITGRAEREVNYNAVEVKVQFYFQAKTTAEALRVIMEQSEKFLEMITAAGVDIKKVHVGNNHVGRSYCEEGINASRAVKIRLPFNMVFINGLMDMIREQDFSAEFDCDYYLLDRKELHAELLKEALDDSKRKAEAVAEIMGQKIVGIDNVEYGGDCDRDWACCEQERGIAAIPGGAALSDELGAPITTEEETVDVVWLIE